MERHGNGCLFSLIGQLIAFLVVIALTVVGTLFALSHGPFGGNKKEPVAVPVILHAIRSSDQLVTAQTQVDAIYTASASSRLPGSEEKVIYFAVYDVQAGIDLSQIKESDIVVDGDTVRITLPPPSIVSQSLNAQKSYVLSHTIGVTAAVGGASKDLMDTVLRNAEQKAKMGVLSDDTLLKAAQENAATNLTQLLGVAGVKNVVFTASPLPTVVPNGTPNGSPTPVFASATPTKKL